MTDSRPAAERILESNRSLRLWAAGLRSWSTSVRAATVGERRRAETLRARASAGRLESPGPHFPALEQREDAPPPGWPSLGDVHVDELLAVLVRRHGFGAVGAARSLQIALLIAGYPSDTDEVLAADSWEILDSALRFSR